MEDLRVARLKNPEKNVVLFKFPKNTIKTLLTETNNGVSDTQFTVRRQFIGTTNSSGVVTFTAGSNETFNAFADADYTLSILTGGGGTGVQGDIVDLDGKLSGTGTASLTVTDNSILGNAGKVKLTATILRTLFNQKQKQRNYLNNSKFLQLMPMVRLEQEQLIEKYHWVVQMCLDFRQCLIQRIHLQMQLHHSLLFLIF